MNLTIIVIFVGFKKMVTDTASLAPVITNFLMITA